MKRSGFKRPTLERKPRAPLVPPAEPSRAVLRMVDTRARLTVMPKGEKAKPGKRPPTKAEAEWMDQIIALGCIACRIDGHPDTPGAVHHLLRGGRRMGHFHTICLCDPGHHQNGAEFGKVSRHPWKARFEEKYGTEQELLAMTMTLVSERGG